MECMLVYLNLMYLIHTNYEHAGKDFLMWMARNMYFLENLRLFSISHYHTYNGKVTLLKVNIKKGKPSWK